MCAALIGIILGALVTLLGSPLPYSQCTIYIISALGFFGSLVVLYSIKVVIQPDEIHHVLHVYVAYHKDEGGILPLTNRFHSFMQQSFMLLRDGAEINPEPINILKSNDFNAIQVLAMDLIIYCLFDWLSQRYRFWWAPKTRFTGVSYERRSFRVRSEITLKEISYSDLPEQMKEQNTFFQLYEESLISHRSLRFSVPEYTKFRWEQQNDAFTKNTISFCNKYCNLDISILHLMGGVGLFPFQSSFFLTEDGQEMDSTYIQDHYAYNIFEMDLHATFNWFWSLMNKSDDYFNWIEDIRDGLDDFFNLEREFEALEKSETKFKLE